MSGDDAAELRLAELLASKVLHDLAGLLGAVGNGMELLAMEQGGEEAVPCDPEALDLATRSARRAVDLLQFSRIAYGRSSATDQENPVVLKRLAEGAVAGGRVRLEWPDDLPTGLPEGAGRLALSLTALAAAALPRGGLVALRRPAASDNDNPSSGAPLWFSVSAEGERTALPADLADALRPDANAAGLTPRNVHAFLAQRLARSLGAEILPHAATGQVSLRVASVS